MKRILCLLLLAASIRIAPAEVEWKPKCNMDNQLFPSLILATATVRPDDEDADPDPVILGDTYGLLGISITAPAAGTNVKVTVRENGLMASSTWSGKLAKADGRYFIAPKINYKFDQLRRTRQQQPLNVTFALEVDGKPVGEQTETLNVRSLNDCPWAVLEREETIDDETPSGGLAGAAQPGDAARKERRPRKDSSEETADNEAEEEWEDLGWMGAAYVNESSPALDEILKEALEYGWVTSFAGYQRGPDDVLREVLAIWSALQNRGIRYSSITATPGGSERVHSQHIRFVDESLANKQANCADGSVLLSSILRKLGLRTFLVYVPGHMYVGFYLKSSGDARVALETTMLGEDNTEPTIIRPLARLAKDLGDDAEEPDWKSFAGAIAAGTEDLRKNAAKFEDEDEANYQIIEVDAARKVGIMPIAPEKL